MCSLLPPQEGTRGRSAVSRTACLREAYAWLYSLFLSCVVVERVALSGSTVVVVLRGGSAAMIYLGEFEATLCQFHHKLTAAMRKFLHADTAAVAGTYRMTAHAHTCPPADVNMTLYATSTDPPLLPTTLPSVATLQQVERHAIPLRPRRRHNLDARHVGGVGGGHAAVRPAPDPGPLPPREARLLPL